MMTINFINLAASWIQSVVFRPEIVEHTVLGCELLEKIQNGDLNAEKDDPLEILDFIKKNHSRIEFIETVLCCAEYWKDEETGDVQLCISDSAIPSAQLLADVEIWLNV